MRNLALAIVLALAGCAGTMPEEADCQKAVADLQADKMSGMGCEMAKSKEAAAHPLCKLVFVCNLNGRDAGHE